MEFVRLNLIFPCSMKLFNLLSTDNYLRKIVSGRVYGIFFCDFYYREISRETNATFPEKNTQCTITSIVIRTIRCILWRTIIVARSNEIRLRYTIMFLILFRILIGISFNLETRSYIFFFLNKRKIYFKYKYKIVKFEYKNYINFVRYSSSICFKILRFRGKVNWINKSNFLEKYS